MESYSTKRLLACHWIFLYGFSLLYLAFGQGVLQFQEGEKIVLDCRSTKEVGKNLTYSWSKNETRVVSGGRIFIDKIGKLIISNSTLTDRGSYVCAENDVAKISFLVKILKSNKKNKEAGKLKTYYVRLRLVNNDKSDAVLRYTINGQQKEFQVPSNAHHSEIIPIKAPSQPPTVVFRAYEVVGNAALQMNDQDTFSVVPTLKNKAVTLYIPNAYLWFVNQIPGNIQLIRKNVGESIALDCYARGAPPPEVLWFKWNRTITDVSYRFVSVQDTSKLWYFKMDNLVLADSGDYHCAVKNRLASKRRKFHVVVQEREAKSKPQIETLSPRNETIHIGSSIVFKCVSNVAKIMPYIRWEKRMLYNPQTKPKNDSAANSTTTVVDKMVSARMEYIRRKIGNGNVTVRERGLQRELIEQLKTERTFRSTLSINAADYSDEAEYVCTTFNTIGFSTTSAFLYVRPVPVPTLEELAKRYANKFGGSGPYSDLPLSVIIALPVGLIVLLVIGFIWWNEQHQRRKESDSLSLIPLATMRNDDMFDSEEHLPSHYPKNHLKRLSQGRATTSEEDNRSSSQRDEEPEVNCLSKVLANPLTASPNNDKSKQSLKDEEKPECDRRVAALLLSDVGMCSPEPDSINCSEVELEWEPQDLDLNLGLVH